MTITLVLPAYNEGENLALLLDQVIQLDLSLALSCIIVNDGSTDNTEEVAKRYTAKFPSITLISHTQNQGLPAALRTGFSAATINCSAADVVVCMDADNTHPPSQIPKMLEMVERGYDVVIASRYRKGAKIAGVSLFRRTLSASAATLFSCLLPVKGVRDFSCGFRAYRSTVLSQALHAFGEEVFALRGFACTTGLLLALNRLGAKMTEIPIDLRYQQKRGVSKINLSRTISESLKLLLRERRLRGSRPTRPV